MAAGIQQINLAIVSHHEQKDGDVSRWRLLDEVEALQREHGKPPTEWSDVFDWCWYELGIHVSVARLPAGVLGMAQLVERAAIRGCVTISEGITFPLWVLAHEVGHVLTRAVYRCDWIGDGHRWRTVHEERIATELGSVLFLDYQEIARRLSDGMVADQVGRELHVPSYAVALRLRLEGISL